MISYVKYYCKLCTKLKAITDPWSIEVVERLMSEASIASTDSSNSSVRGLASFGERMALVMHKWTWQHLFKTTAQKRSERPPHCQGRRRGGGKPVKYATSRASSSKKVHYADFEASQIQ